MFKYKTVVYFPMISVNLFLNAQFLQLLDLKYNT